jgi:hypothetical protein|tara:strand:- start:2312 stop:2629 length:318 start_codon:yes stop_codon:yes gene_type:complete
MKVSNCCGAMFYEPGYPDSDICSACKEHAMGVEEGNPKAVKVPDIHRRGFMMKNTDKEKCVVCGDEFDKYSGNIDKRICVECVLINEDPDAINPSGKNMKKKKVG